MSIYNDPTNMGNDPFQDSVSHGTSPDRDGICLMRRRFVQGLAMGGAFAGLGLGTTVLSAGMKQQGLETLRGTEFNLTIGEQAVNFTGGSRVATTINGCYRPQSCVGVRVIR